MKQGTDSLLKFHQLQARLGLALWETKGLLQSLWDFTDTNAPAGDVGRFANPDIALALGYRRRRPDFDGVVAALLDTGWLDAHPKHRLIVHDWHEHCENRVHARLARKFQHFANGEVPSLNYLGKDAARVRAKWLEMTGHNWGNRAP